MDQGIICALKGKYRSLAVRKLIAALEKKNPLPTISILSADDVGKGVECCSNKIFTKWKKCLMTKMTTLLA